MLQRRSSVHLFSCMLAHPIYCCHLMTFSITILFPPLLLPSSPPPLLPFSPSPLLLPLSLSFFFLFFPLFVILPFRNSCIISNRNTFADSHQPKYGSLFDQVKSFKFIRLNFNKFHTKYDQIRHIALFQSVHLGVSKTFSHKSILQNNKRKFLFEQITETHSNSIKF